MNLVGQAAGYLSSRTPAPEPKQGGGHPSLSPMQFGKMPKLPGLGGFGGGAAGAGEGAAAAGGGAELAELAPLLLL